MKLSLLLVILFCFTCTAYSQVVTCDPANPTERDSITVYFHADQGDKGLMNYTGDDVYAHTGVITDKGDGWRYVIAEWNINLPKAKLTKVSANLYKLSIKPNPKIFYNVPSNEKIKQLAFVFRNSDGSKTGRDVGGKDIFFTLNDAGLNISVISPAVSPYFVNINDTIKIKAAAYIVPARTSKIKISLYSRNNLIYQADNDTINYLFINKEGSAKASSIKIVAEDTSGLKQIDSIVYYPNPRLIVEDLPQNVKDGINYVSDQSVTLVLFAPHKKFTYLIGDFNNWSIDSSYFMKRTPDSSRYWITINNLTLQQEYAYQYYVDGQIKIADPYTEKVLDPNDQYITPATYPNLKPYPADKTDNIVSILQTGQAEYQWQAANFTRPAKTDLVIYELLVRDFVSTHNYKTLKDTLGYLKRLGITAIELMPVNEFEGNESWGYNPSFYFAPDKYYGTKNDLKAFIDECHKNGIAVIQDMVLNHSFGQSPMVRLYWDSQNNRPAANSPWFNPIPKHEFNVGYDFNHESPATKAFSKRVMEFWLSEYKVDGFRFDLSKGFTQKNTLGNVDAMAQYDQSRINIWKDYSSFIWSVDSNAYVILEHFADNSEEKVLSAAGMMLWGNMNKKYSEATMGWNDADNSDFSFVSYKARGWQRPNLVGYMESHDEERLMFKDIKYGNKSTIYNIQDTSQSLNRIKLAAAFFFTIPGPKMIWQFGELGYDYSIDYNGRLGNKPIRWDYYNDPKRRKLYKVFQALIKLREENEVFESTNYSIFLSGAVKRINIADSSMNVTIIGNFDVLNKSIIPSFQNTGIWYDYFSGDSTNVANTQDFINLQPGEFHVYTSKKLATPETDILSDVQETKANEVNDFSLEQNYPNPFNPVTTIKYTVGTRPSITGGVFVQLKVYDLLGREVITLVNKEQGPGKYEVKFDGGKLSSGLYIYRIQYGGIMLSRKMLLLK